MVTAATLHPAARRKIQRMMPPEAHHEVVLRPLGAGDARTVIATSGAQDFIEELFENLAAEDWRARLSSMRQHRRGSDGLLELGLPIHRRFQLALFEAVCHQPGSPRLDPSRISSQGMVVRRSRGGGWSGWMTSGRNVSGWLPLADGDADPDPARRGGPAANRVARRIIESRSAPTVLAEEMAGLYIAPPDICAARGRTILFGVIPVASGARSDGPADAIDYSGLPSAQRADMVGHISEYLKARPPLAMPRSGEVLAAGWNVMDPPGPELSDAARVNVLRLNAFGTFLHQLVTELDAFGAGAAPKALREALSEISLPLARDGGGRVTASSDAATFLSKAVPILLDREANADHVRMPLEWPRVETALGDRLTRAALDCLSARHAQLARSPGKFEVLTDRYAVRAFVRVRGPSGCPDRLVWSAYSEPFRILPWWDGDGPGTRISLPDMSQLKKVKPNVAFEMPPAIANLLKGDMKKLADGEGKESDTEGLQIGWLCSFSIPFITICAFIVLNIFLSLFDIIFRWMMFIKVCIPIPKKG